MLDKIQSEFSIRDLSRLSGISVHNIRIWERRYGLLNPERTETNIRKYNSNDLRRLLNISDLKQNGFKISEIAGLSESELLSKLENLNSPLPNFEKAVSSFKLAMFHFNRFLFEKTWKELETRFSFNQIFLNACLPLLDQIGSLWQTGSIQPSNEHFISNLLRQKLFLKIDKESFNKPVSENLFVLFLPLKEIHELGLLYIHYALLQAGLNSVYLGTELDFRELITINKSTDRKITYVSYWTIDTGVLNEEPIFEDFNRLLLLPNGKNELFITGRKSPLNLELPQGIHSVPHPGKLIELLTGIK